MNQSIRRTLTLVISCLPTLALAAPAALAAPKEVAYRCDLDICLLDPDNPGDVTNLTFNGATSYDEEPVWSPDGKKLAFVATFNNKFPPTPNVFVMEPEAPDQAINLATEVTHYANGAVPLAELAWSPDGSKIAFARGNANPGSQLLFVAESNGTSANPLQISPHGGHPSWSPDGSKIAFWFSNQVYLKNSDGSGPESPLANGAGREPSWSPDGSRIAFGFPAHPSEFLDLHIVCGDITCGANSKGTARYVGPPSVVFRPKKGKTVTKTILVGRGKTKIPANTTRKLKLTVTRAGAAALKHLGKLTVKVKVTIKAGTEKVTRTHSVRVVFKPRRR